MFFPKKGNPIINVIQEEYDPKLWNCLNDELGKLERHMETSGGDNNFLFFCRLTRYLLQDQNNNLVVIVYNIHISLVPSEFFLWANVCNNIKKQGSNKTIKGQDIIPML